MSIDPNPIQNNLLIEFEDSNEATIEIFTENGQLLMLKTITSSQNNINTSNLQTGMYWVKLTSNKGTTTKKFIKN
ncbi:T9SS type A sorting domain-containing protein [Wenyingzhuangia sp. chi5]|uniref:T9SS type A sorting domain-containing protein n=1 Tax=Wenyingzhuangia gilva TaxID=3057677 RepID=A0ABT8VS40_9FLAO|nr:T9SS type A sorting domain-containing protein [Wenyingzhuangia sp. chi5]MDO3694785.1 T9SS type A sorting domain-containing protein [Wenyingzhuangia sp. chi5]